MKQKRFWALLLTLLVLFAAVMPALALPAAAEDGDVPFIDGETNGDGEGEPPTDPVEPSPSDDPPPTDDPSPPPTDEPPPTDDPGSSQPGGDDPVSSDPSQGGDPTPPPTDDPGSSQPEDDDPVSSDPNESSDPGYVEPDNNHSGGSSGSTGSTGSTGNTGGTISSRPRIPGSAGSTILHPSLGTSSATPNPNSSSSGQVDASAPLEPNYVTFARVNQRNNSMSIVLFYSGAGCIGVGVLGLVVLVVFIVRGRQNAGDRDEIFEEIQHAEIRQPVRPRPVQPSRPAGASGHTDGYGLEPQPTLHRPEPEALSVPVNGNLYTEEFEIPQQFPSSGQPRPDPLPLAPAPSSMYTEEFDLPDEMAQPPQRMRPQEMPPAVRPAQRPDVPSAPPQPSPRSQAPSQPTRPRD
ncbi:MAG: hypothetical protein HFE94_03185, partial [Acutalibacter sp.]|nr:hypothetical protein [Acutalibacter sp.]